MVYYKARSRGNGEIKCLLNGIGICLLIYTCTIFTVYLPMSYCRKNFETQEEILVVES